MHEEEIVVFRASFRIIINRRVSPMMTTVAFMWKTGGCSQYTCERPDANRALKRKPIGSSLTSRVQSATPPGKPRLESIVRRILSRVDQGGYFEYEYK